mgnify:CR=1 FL=1
MPKKKGGKKKSGKKGSSTGETKRPLVLADAMEEYAKIMSMLGDRRVKLVMTDSTQVMGVIPGRFRKRVWMGTGDVVLVARRQFQSGKVDILHKYTPAEMVALFKQDEIPNFFLVKEATHDTEADDDAIIFSEEGLGMGKTGTSDSGKASGGDAEEKDTTNYDIFNIDEL